jgi:hypothetical protein
MKMRMSRALLAVAATVAATAMFTTTSASASTPARAITPPHPSAITAHGAAVAQSATDCPWFFNDNGVFVNVGTVICAYQPGPYVEFPNGTEETFAIGTSHAIWTAWNNTSGVVSAASLGGLGYSTPWIVTQSGWGLTLGVSSSSGGHYCDNRGDSESSGWTGWFKC